MLFCGPAFFVLQIQRPELLLLAQYLSDCQIRPNGEDNLKPITIWRFSALTVNFDLYLSKLIMHYSYDAKHLDLRA